jgi:antitoxin (DNA-binding transcriptional repressor) of toxin-antitoxin stability system
LLHCTFSGAKDYVSPFADVDQNFYVQFSIGHGFKVRGETVALARRGETVALARRGETVALARQGETVALARRGETVALARRGETVALARRGETVALSRWGVPGSMGSWPSVEARHYMSACIMRWRHETASARILVILLSYHVLATTCNHEMSSFD